MVTSRSATRGTAFLAPAIVALIALLAPRADALKIDFPPDGKVHHRRCPRWRATFSGSFMLIEEGAVLKRWDGVFDLTVRDESRNVVYTARHTSEHRFEFNSEKAGAHEFCFTNLKPRPVVLFYNAAVGHHWSHDAATHTHLSDLQRALQSLRQVTGEVKVEVRYQKARRRPSVAPPRQSTGGCLATPCWRASRWWAPRCSRPTTSSACSRGRPRSEEP